MIPDNPEPKPFELLEELGKFSLESGVPLNHPQAVPKFATFAEDVLSKSLANPALLHGKRTEAMFEAMLVSLGGYSLLKSEDSGRVYPKEDFQAPDFRAVLPDGTQWLIEVKNVYIHDPMGQKKRLMTRAYRQKLENYASATGGQLKLAVYWARWGIWTLVSPERSLDGEGNLTLDLKTGLVMNELGQLGDRTIGTRPPIRFRLESVQNSTNQMTPDGLFKFTISNARIYSDEDEILDPTEKQIAWMFMLYGNWKEVDGPQSFMEGGQLTAVEFQWEPEARLNAGFEVIGTLSSMFSRYYAEQTLENRKVMQFHAPSRPGWFEPLVMPNYEKKALPLWMFNLQPAKA